MEFSVLQTNLLRAIQDVQKAVSSRPTLPILSCVLVDVSETEIHLVATDLQVGIRTKIEGKIKTSGKVAIPAKIFADLIATLDSGEISLSLEGATLQIISTQAKAQIQTFPAEDFPVFPEKEGEEVTIPLSFFAPATQATTFSAAVEDSRPVLTTLLIRLGEEMEIVATDGFRLSRITLPYQTVQKQLLLPARAILEVVRIATRKNTQNVVFTVSEKLKQAFFSVDDVEMLIRVMDGEFPPYQKIIPDSFATQIVFDAQEFSQKMKTANIFARESSNIIKISLSGETLKILSSSSTLGKQESTLQVHVLQGGDQEVAFNGKYLQDFLTVMKPERVWMGINESMKPVVFRPESQENFLYVVMPFRVNST